MVERENSTISVDIGCGPKNNLVLYSKETGDPTIAIDINRNFLQERKNNHSGNLAIADAHHLPIKHEVAETVFLTHVLEHVNSAEDVLAEVGRITTREAKIVVAVPDPNFESVMSKIEPSYHSPTMHRRVIEKDVLKHMVENHDFNITEVRSRGFVTAIAITLSYLWHLRIKKDRHMELQSGRLIGEENHQKTANSAITNSSNSFIQEARILYHTIEGHPLLGRLFFWNKMYPFENVVRATRN